MFKKDSPLVQNYALLIKNGLKTLRRNTQFSEFA